MFNKIGIVGLGLIGGSFAKAIKAAAEIEIFAYDRNQSTISSALEEKVIDGVLDDTTLPLCDLIVLVLYPNDIVEYVRSHKMMFSKNCCIIDFGGIKRQIIYPCKEILQDTGIPFIGCHPMAGREVSGYKNSLTTLFRGSNMIIVPDAASAEMVKQLEALFKIVGFGRITITTPENHDQVIAFTSQLAHVLSNAYIKSPRAEQFLAYSGGSFQDLTRVAKLNPTMWTELFMINRDNLVDEIDLLISHLQQYSNALKNCDEQELYTLLKAGSDIKEKLNHEYSKN
ncbi:MAG: prephenate dehydrogenase/arogenate dehydrogenase family protein [Oscillospiraceae bacterium]